MDRAPTGDEYAAHRLLIQPDAARWIPGYQPVQGIAAAIDVLKRHWSAVVDPFLPAVEPDVFDPKAADYADVVEALIRARETCGDGSLAADVDALFLAAAAAIENMDFARSPDAKRLAAAVIGYLEGTSHLESAAALQERARATLGV